MSLIPSGELKDYRHGGLNHPAPKVSMSLIPSGELKASCSSLRVVRYTCINESNSLRGVERLETVRVFVHVHPGINESNSLRGVERHRPEHPAPTHQGVSMSLIPSGELKAHIGHWSGLRHLCINESNSLRGVERSNIFLACPNYNQYQ